MAKVWKTGNTKCWQGCGAPVTHTARGRVNGYPHCVKFFLGIYRNCADVYLMTQPFETQQKHIPMFTERCVSMFIAIGLIMALNWKQPKDSFIQWSNSQ